MEGIAQQRTTQLVFDEDIINYRSTNGKPWYMFRRVHCSNCGRTFSFMFDFLSDKDLNKKKVIESTDDCYCSRCGCLFENRMEMILKDVEDVEAQGE